MWNHWTRTGTNTAKVRTGKQKCWMIIMITTCIYNDLPKVLKAKNLHSTKIRPLAEKGWKSLWTLPDQDNTFFDLYSFCGCQINQPARISLNLSSGGTVTQKHSWVIHPPPPPILQYWFPPGLMSCIIPAAANLVWRGGGRGGGEGGREGTCAPHEPSVITRVTNLFLVLSIKASVVRFWARVLARCPKEENLMVWSEIRWENRLFGPKNGRGFYTAFGGVNLLSFIVNTRCEFSVLKISCNFKVTQFTLLIFITK